MFNQTFLVGCGSIDISEPQCMSVATVRTEREKSLLLFYSTLEWLSPRDMSFACVYNARDGMPVYYSSLLWLIIILMKHRSGQLK